MQAQEGDEYVFESSVRSNETTPLFNERKVTYITDQTSNQGQFNAGQIQFSLDTLGSQSQWVDLKDAVIEFPIKMEVKNVSAVSSTGGLYSTILKNGFHQWIDGVQLVINGTTIQSSQVYENIAASFRILSTWSQDTLQKYGATTGVALDDVSGSHGNSASTSGLANATLASITPPNRGIDTVTTAGVGLVNRGVASRARWFNQSATTSDVIGGLIGSSGLVQSGQANAAGTSSSVAGNTIYVQYVMATVRLRDLCDIEQLPLLKNLKGFLYINCNQFQVDISASSSAVSSVTYSPLSGRTCPFVANIMSVAPGLNPGTSATVSVTGRIDGTSTVTGFATAAAPVITQGRLLAPFYTANPRIDAALTKSAHKFSTLDKLVNPIQVSKGQSINYTVTVGVPNARRLVLLPMWQNLGGSTTLTNLSSPAFSAFDCTPATSGVYAYLQNLQVLLGNKAIFQNPINYDFEMWANEISTTGAYGGHSDEMASGLLSQSLWSQNHRYYTVDLGRRMDSEDNASKSVQVSFTNPSATYDMQVIAIVFYERKWEVDTAKCQISSAV